MAEVLITKELQSGRCSRCRQAVMVGMDIGLRAVVVPIPIDDKLDCFFRGLGIPTYNILTIGAMKWAHTRDPSSAPPSELVMPVWPGHRCNGKLAPPVSVDPPQRPARRILTHEAIAGRFPF